MLHALIAGAVGLALLALAIHPLLLYPLTLMAFAPRLPKVVPADATVPPARPTVAICVSAYNEEKVIEAKIESLLAMVARYGPATIHVYADGPSDRTAEILSAYADRIDLVVSTERRGKTYGLNLLVDRSDSELLLFTDANVSNDPTALGGLVRAFADPGVGGVSAQLSYTNPGDSPTSAAGALYWHVEERIKAIESETVGLIGVDGAMFMVRRALYRPAPPHLIDDLYVSLSVLIQGYRIVSVQSVTVGERSAVRSHEEYLRKMRIACQAVNVHRALWPQLRRMPALPLYAYISHRLIKWMTPFSVLAAALCLYAALGMVVGWFAATMLVALGLAAVVVGDRLAIKPFPLIVTALHSLSGVGIGVCQSLFTGRTYTVWTPANSIRDATVSERVEIEE